MALESNLSQIFSCISRQLPARFDNEQSSVPEHDALHASLTCKVSVLLKVLLSKTNLYSCSCDIKIHTDAHVHINNAMEMQVIAPHIWDCCIFESSLSILRISSRESCADDVAFILLILLMRSSSSSSPDPSTNPVKSSLTVSSLPKFVRSISQISSFSPSVVSSDSIP